MISVSYEMASWAKNAELWHYVQNVAFDLFELHFWYVYILFWKIVVLKISQLINSCHFVDVLSAV